MAAGASCLGVPVVHSGRYSRRVLSPPHARDGGLGRSPARRFHPSLAGDCQPATRAGPDRGNAPISFALHLRRARWRLEFIPTPKFRGHLRVDRPADGNPDRAPASIGRAARVCRASFSGKGSTAAARVPAPCFVHTLGQPLALIWPCAHATRDRIAHRHVARRMPTSRRHLTAPAVPSTK
jgi:hypothetical protein